MTPAGMLTPERVKVLSVLTAAPAGWLIVIEPAVGTAAWLARVTVATPAPEELMEMAPL